MSLEKHHLMMGVPPRRCAQRRQPRSGDIEAVQHIAAQHTEQAPKVRVLPERIYLHELDPHPPGPDADYRTRWTIRSAFASRT